MLAGHAPSPRVSSPPPTPATPSRTMVFPVVPPMHHAARVPTAAPQAVLRKDVGVPGVPESALAKAIPGVFGSRERHIVAAARQNKLPHLHRLLLRPRLEGELNVNYVDVHQRERNALWRPASPHWQSLRSALYWAVCSRFRPSLYLLGWLILAS